MRFLFLLFISTSVMAATCDCEVRVYHPTTASQKINSAVMLEYQLETFDSYSIRSQRRCRALCLQKFREDLPSERLTALLQTLSERLIDERVVGYNCTGLTTFRYPLRVKANLGRLSLGNVEDRMEVVTFEQPCF